MNTSTRGCGCGSSTQLCDLGTMNRPRYFPRQLITPVELTLEQQYFRDKMRRHNRLLHGWGVVCGAQVCQVIDATTNAAQPWMVTVQPGYILGPYGDEILIESAQGFDLRTTGPVSSDGSGGASDPWCTPVRAQPPSGSLYVAVSYQETMCRQVRVQPTGCGCDEAQCEYSRWQDGFALGVLTQCPATNQSQPSFDNLFRGAPRPDCPTCPASPWVVLATVTVDSGGNIHGIDNCSCRRLVVGWSNIWWQCTDTPTTVTVAKTAQAPQTTAFTLEAEVSRALPAGFKADFGPGVTATVSVVSQGGADNQPVAINVSGQVAANAAIGVRPLRLEQANGCLIAVADKALNVTTATGPAPSSGPGTNAGQAPNAAAGTPAAGTPAANQSAPAGTPAANQSAPTTLAAANATAAASAPPAAAAAASSPAAAAAPPPAAAGVARPSGSPAPQPPAATATPAAKRAPAPRGKSPQK